MMAVRPSRMSSPWRFSSFSLRRPLARAYLLSTAGEGGAEALDVHAALDGGDAVGEAVETVGVEAGVPLEGDLDLLLGLGLLEVADLGEQRVLGGVEVANEVDDAAGVLVGDRLGSRPRRDACPGNGSRGPC